MFNDKIVLVTGGTGSFGKQFIKNLLERYKPKKIIVYSRDELKQYEMALEFNSSVIDYLIGDVRDAVRMRQALRGVDHVVHAAALKQVPAAEYNPMECIKTNIHGAENIIEGALENNVEKVIALSTDKAVYPISLYGATKLASDKLFVSANNLRGRHRTRFSVVRYGNVVGTRGSVIPLFERLIAEGAKELPITDECMTRFWITLRQGIDFVIQSFSRMQGGEVFVLKMPSVRILDLAESVAPGMPVRIVGRRPGEKRHEIICPKDDSHLTLEFEDHYILCPSIAFNFPNDFTTNAIGEKGRKVAEGFEYSSESDGKFLTVEEIRELHKST